MELLLTHMQKRISNLTGLSKEKDPEKNRKRFIKIITKRLSWFC